MLDQSLIVSKSILIEAKIEHVWDVLTNPEKIKIYLYDTDVKTTWILGDDIIFQGEYAGTKYKDSGVILEFKPFTKISYSYWSGFSGLEDLKENRSTVTYLISNINENQIQLTWIQQGYANKESYLHTENRMDAFLMEIRKVVEMNS